MAHVPIDVHADSEARTRVAGAHAVQPQPQPRPQQQPQAQDAQEVEAEVVSVSNAASDPRRRPTNYDIIAHAANTLDAASGVATQVGADAAAEVTREAANVARAIPAAVEGGKREIKPLKKASSGLWGALARRGIVGVGKRVNMAAMQ